MHVMYDKGEIPNVKCMCIVEEEVSLSQPKTAAVPLEEEEVPVLQGASVAVPLEEEEFLAPGITVLQGPLSRSHRRKRRS
jgi:hypothetical protein